MTRPEEIGIKEARVRELMKKLKLKGMLFKTQANFCWLTAGGLNEVTVADTLGVTSILITEKDRLVLSNRIEAPRMMEDEGLKELGFSLVQFEWYDGEEYKEVAGIVDPGQVGCDAPGFGYTCFAKEAAELRYALLESEIERYAWMGRKASMAVETVLSGARPGMKESALIGEVLRILWYDRIDSICNQAAADERSRKYRHGIPTEKCVDKYLTLNVNARKWGLVTTITRAVHFGKMSPAFRRQFEDTVWIENGMIAASKPGAVMKDIFAATKRLYAEKGRPDEWKLHHQGGAQGYRNRDYLMLPNGEEKIAENQCICWNPTIAGPDFGTKSEDAFVALRGGPFFITQPVIFPSLSMRVGGIDFVRPGVLEL